MTRRNTTTALATNRKMNDETYAMRRKVMDIIYSMRKQVALPRIEVRISDMHDATVVGLGRMGAHVIWISTKSIDSPYLREIVLHEILHAVIVQEHVKDCPLMGEALNTRPLDQKIADRLFIQYMSKATKK